MEFTKKRKLLTATLISSIAGGLVVAGFAMNKDGTFKAKAEDISYTITLSAENGKINEFIGEEDFLTFDASVDKKENCIYEFLTGEYVSPKDNAWASLDFYSYVFNVDKINGIKSIKIKHIVNEEEGYSDFNLCWGWEEPILDLYYENFGFDAACSKKYKGYDVDEVIEFDFYDELPNYFALLNLGGSEFSEETIEYIQITYSCVEEGERPEYLNSPMGEMTYEELDDGSFNISSYNSTEYEEVIVESTFRGKKINGFSKDTDFGIFRFSENVKTLDLSNLDITSIPNSLMNDQKSLETVILPTTIKEVGDSAFSGCPNLVNLDIDIDGLTTIGGSAFADTGLTSFVIPSSVASIGITAFSSNKNLEKVYFRKISSLSVGQEIFKSCPTGLICYFEDKEEDLSELISSGTGDSGIFAIRNGAGTILAGYSKTYEEFLAR